MNDGDKPLVGAFTLSEDPRILADELIAFLSRNDTVEQQQRTNIYRKDRFNKSDWFPL